MKYDFDFLENTKIFTEEEIELLDKLTKKVSLNDFLNNKSFVDKFGLDFIHTSAKIEGNTYSQIDTLTLLDYGITAGGKKYTDAKMILNLREAYNLLLSDNLSVNKNTLKDIHYILSNEMVAQNERATPRNEEVSIKGSEYIPLSSKEHLNDEFDYMLSKYQTIKNPFNKALYIHCNVAYLQYFKDCNKRTARMMLNISLKNDNKMLYIPNQERVSDYLASIVSYYETGNYNKFKAYFIQEYSDTINKIASIKQNRKIELNTPLRKEKYFLSSEKNKEYFERIKEKIDRNPTYELLTYPVSKSMVYINENIEELN